MAVEKFSISLPQDLVSEIDALADADGVTRSGFVREVMSEYVTKRHSDAWLEERRERIGRAIEGMRKMREEWGPDEKTGLEYLHEIREERMQKYGLHDGVSDE